MSAAGSRGQRAGASRARSERGSTLATLALVVAVMSIMLTVATQEWHFILQREKEKELIFRGQRILAAIEEFQSGGRSITKLEDLTKQPKPALRRIPPEPMTARFDEDGKLVEGTGQWRILRQGQQGQAQPPLRADDESEEGERRERRSGEPAIQTGPIAGVASSSDEESIGAYGEIPAGTPYSEWRFEVIGMQISGRMAQTTRRPERPFPPGFAGLRVPGGPPVQTQPQPPPAAQAPVPGGPRSGPGGPSSPRGIPTPRGTPRGERQP